MEKQFKLDNNGQQVQQQDFNLLGEAAGLADDRVYAELLRMTAFNGSVSAKGILPYGPAATVAVNGASGSVLVNPFRAFVGSRTAVATDAEKNWRDIRSTLSVAEGAAALTLVAAIGANSSGNPRWDLVYAAVTIDANSPSSTRKVKDPTTKVVAPASVSTYKRTKLVIGVVPGTAAASPVFPAIPADSGGVYNIPLAYVRVPNGFNASSTVLPTDIADQAPVLHIATSSGAQCSRPGTWQNTINTAHQQSWGASGSNRFGMWMPPSMVGGETLWFAISLSASDPDKPATGTVIDTGDWRERMVTWMAAAAFSNGDPDFPWTTGSPLSTIPGGAAYFTGSTFDPNTQVYAGMSSTINGGGVMLLTNANGATGIDTGSTVSISCDASTGNLKINYTGNPHAKLIVRCDFSGRYANR